MMISSNLIVVFGPERYISVFDIPREAILREDGAVYTLRPKWKYECDRSFSEDDSEMLCSKFYKSCDPSPRVWVLEGDTALHYLRFSPVEQSGKPPVNEHRVIPVTCSPDAVIRLSREMWCSGIENACTSDPMDLGEFLIPLKDKTRGLDASPFGRYVRFSFEEVSGCVSFEGNDRGGLCILAVELVA